MKTAFFHDAPLVYRGNGLVYSVGFSYNIWQRYLAVFDSIVVSTRMDVEDSVCDSVLKNMKLSSGPRVEFKPISEYRKNTDLIFNRRKILCQIRQTLDICDCAIIRLPSFIGNIACQEAVRLYKPYLVEVVGCAWDALWNHSLKGKIIAFPSYLAMKKSVKDAPYAVYVTNEFLQRRYSCNGKTIACSNVVLPPLDEVVLDRRLKKIEQMKKHEPIVLGTIGAINVRYKGQEYVIKAISKLNKKGYNFEYHLVGGGDSRYLKYIVDKYNIVDKVKFLGTLPHRDVFRYLDSIDIYIQPSITEGLPRALIEAMSRGCPAIGSNVGGIPELLLQKVIIKPRDYKDMAKKIYRLANDSQLLKKQAIYNFTKSQDYTNSVINARRNKFLSHFVRHC